MIKRVLLVVLFLFSFSEAKEKNEAKFLVVDSNVYEKIQMLSILDGGIKKEYIVSSTRLSNDSLKEFYPEYFIYNAPVCFNINDVYVNNNKNVKFEHLKDKNDIKKEVKKIKLLQMLSESKTEEIGLSKINDKIIKSVGIICDKNLFLRGKAYNINSEIGEFKIKSINTKNATISLEKR